MGIRRFCVRIWTADQDKLLGTVPDLEIAKKLGCKEANVQLRRKRLGIPASRSVALWTTEEDQLLGKLTDKEIARKLGRSVIAVAGRRLRLKIPAPPLQNQRTWTPAEDALLGKMMDRELAKRLGCPQHVVAHAGGSAASRHSPEKPVHGLVLKKNCWER